MKEFIIKGLNFDISWKRKNLNFQKIENAFQDEEADLFLLPEMFSTGFCMDAEEIADQNNESLNWMKDFASRKNTAICGSVSIKENGKFYNRMYFVEPNGNFQQYDKRHLFTLAGEDKVYTSGIDKLIVDYHS